MPESPCGKEPRNLICAILPAPCRLAWPPLLWRRRSSADITQSARTDPIDLPALIVAVIVIVPERVAESESLEATMMREPPAGTAEAMTAEPAAQSAEMSGAQRSTEVRAGT